jgi:hypothetical protein
VKIEGKEAVSEFAAELNRLRALAGTPSLMRLVELSAGLAYPLARATISDKLNAKSPPRWEFVVSFVTACLDHAGRTGVSLPSPLADLGWWDSAYWRMLAGGDAASERRRLSGVAQIRLVAPASPKQDDDVIVPRQLPAAVGDFVGREAQLRELAELAELSGRGGGVGIGIVSGMAGVGKTALALWWAHRIADQFPDGQAFVHLRGFDPSGSPTRAGEALRWLLGAFGVPQNRIPVEAGARAALWRSVVAGRRVLLVLDNARDTDQVRPLLPGTSGCLVLVTSRIRLPGLVTGHGARSIVVEPMPEEQARRLLTSRVGQECVADAPAAVQQVLRRCAGLPLALAIVAARVLVHPGRTLAAELDRWDDAGLDPFAGVDSGLDIRDMLRCSYEALGAAAARVLRLCGLHGDPVLTVASVARLAGVPLRQAQELLAELVQANMIVESAAGGYVLHDLVRAYVVERACANDTKSGWTVNLRAQQIVRPRSGLSV